MNTRDDDYPCAEGFSNLVTSILAESLTSHVEVWALLEKAGAFRGVTVPTAEMFRAVIEPYVVARKGWLLRRDADLSQVQWGEIASCFEREADREADDGLRSSPGHTSARPISLDVLDVLRRSTVDVEQSALKLPAGQLDRELYLRVDEVLRALGGKWVGRKVQAHIFDRADFNDMQAAIATGMFLRPQDVGFFPTPPAQADLLTRLAQIEPGMKVLEPSAGDGALAARAAQMTGSFENVTVCELQKSKARGLRAAGFSAVLAQDFLTVEPSRQFDRVVMNPPFSRGADIDHFLHATKFLKPDGRIAAIMSTSWLQHSGRKAAEFRELIAECDGQVQAIEAGAFKNSGAGTQVPTVLVTVDAADFPCNQKPRPRERLGD